MQSSSHGLSTPVDDNLCVKRYIYVKKNSFTNTENDDNSVIRYQINVKSTGFRSQLEVSRVFSYIEELWYNEPLCLWMTIYKRKKPFKISHIFCNNIYFSRLYIFLNVRSVSSDKEIMRISNGDLEKHTKFRSPYLPDPNFICFF